MRTEMMDEAMICNTRTMAKGGIYQSPLSLGSSHQGRSAGVCEGAGFAVAVPGATLTILVGMLAGAGGTRIWSSVHSTCGTRDQTTFLSKLNKTAHTSPT